GSRCPSDHATAWHIRILNRPGCVRSGMWCCLWCRVCRWCCSLFRGMVYAQRLPTGHSAGPCRSILSRGLGGCPYRALSYRFRLRYGFRLSYGFRLGYRLWLGLCNGRLLLVFNGKRTPPDHATFRHRYQLLRVEISSTIWGKTSNRSPTTPKSATSKIRASSSLLMAIIVLAVCIPAKCCIAPEIPTAIYRSGETETPVWPTCRLCGT